MAVGMMVEVYHRSCPGHLSCGTWIMMDVTRQRWRGVSVVATWAYHCGALKPLALFLFLLHPCSLCLCSVEVMAPRRQLPNGHLATNRRPSPLPQSQETRPPLSPEDVRQLAQRMRETYGWSEDPRPFQLAAVQAQLEGQDMIIQAATGAGKTAIAAGPHLWESSKGKLTIVVSPLLVLEEEMVKTLFKLHYELILTSHCRSGHLRSNLIFQPSL